MNLSITTEQLAPFFTKHHIHGLPFGASLNEFTAPDKGDYHDHPASFTTYILQGGYEEEIANLFPDGKINYYARVRHLPGTCHKVAATDIHKITRLLAGPCITLMVPHSGHVRKSGFWRFAGGCSYFRPWDETEFREYAPLKT